MAKRKSRNPRDIPVVKFPGTEFSEDVVLGELLKSSPKFRAFYETERHKIKSPLRWIFDPRLLPEGVNYTHRRNRAKGEQGIILGQIPVPLDHDVRIAEELLHGVLDDEGFPGVGGVEGTAERIGAALNNVVHDPLIYSRLQEGYDFDMCSKCKEDLEKTIHSLEKSSPPTINSVDWFLWIFNYAHIAQEWDVACCNEGAENEFRLWFDAKFPEIATEAQDLLALVKEIGYDIPEKAADLFEKIIQRYKLEQILILDT